MFLAIAASHPPNRDASRKAVQTGKRAQEYFVNQVFYFARGNLRQQDAVHHARVTLVQLSEGVAMAVLRSLHQSRVGIIAHHRRFRHRKRLRMALPRSSPLAMLRSCHRETTSRPRNRLLKYRRGNHAKC